MARYLTVEIDEKYNGRKPEYGNVLSWKNRMLIEIAEFLSEQSNGTKQHTGFYHNMLNGLKRVDHQAVIWTCRNLVTFSERKPEMLFYLKWETKTKEPMFGIYYFWNGYYQQHPTITMFPDPQKGNWIQKVEE